MIKKLVITETELAMRCTADFCAHLDLTRVVEGRYRADIPDVTFDGHPADIHYELTFERLKAVRLSYDIAFEDTVEITGESRSAHTLALGWINRFIGLCDYQIRSFHPALPPEPYFYLNA